MSKKIEITKEEIEMLQYVKSEIEIAKAAFREASVLLNNAENKLRAKIEELFPKVTGHS